MKFLCHSLTYRVLVFAILTAFLVSAIKIVDRNSCANEPPWVVSTVCPLNADEESILQNESESGDSAAAATSSHVSGAATSSLVVVNATSSTHVNSSSDTWNNADDAGKNENAPNASDANRNDLRASDVEPQIASFDEWTKQKMEEHQSKVADNQNNVAVIDGAAVVPQMAARNYASKECGAKILLANAEAQNVAAVLNEKERDEYMLNPCQTEGKKWFVVELCETVQITKFEVANFELFSSPPKDIRVSSSERYPSPEWNLLGEWTAEDKRQVQQFAVKSRLYAKYLKVELLSHYGAEHFCPLSLIRVLGISMVEEYEIEAMAQDRQSKSTETAAANESVLVVNVSTPLNSSSSSSLVVDHSAKTKSGDYLESAKKAVVTIAKEMYGKAHSVFVGGGAVNLDSKSSTSNKSTCGENLTKDVVSFERLPPPTWTLCEEKSSTNNLPKFCGYYLLLTSKSGDAISTDVADQLIAAPVVEPIPVEESSTSTEHFDDYDAKEFDAPLLPDFPEDKVDNSSPKSSTLNEPLDAAVNGSSRFNLNSSTLVDVQAPPAAQAHATSLPGVATSTKESVFVRLNNRIKNLELNISISSQYLSELSKKYLKQMEDIQRAFNRTSTLFNQNDAKFEERLTKHANDLDKLKEDLAELRPLMATLAKDYVILQKEHVQGILVFVFVEVLVVVCLLRYCCCTGERRKRKEERRAAESGLVVSEQMLNDLVKKAVAKQMEAYMASTAQSVVERPDVDPDPPPPQPKASWTNDPDSEITY